MRLKDLIILILLNVVYAFPAKLLRVPKIYNALITSREKILPSEAYPATTGPIFQPIGLQGSPIIIHPGLFIDKTKQAVNVEDGTEVKVPGTFSETMRRSKPPAPVTFYPRYSLYYAHQPYLTLQQPYIYTAVEVPNSVPSLNTQQAIPQQLEVAERKDLNFQTSKMKLKMDQAGSSIDYVKNNRPADRNIPDIPPPPPPVRFRNVDEDEAK